MRSVSGQKTMNAQPLTTNQQSQLTANLDMTCFPPPPAPGEQPGIGPPPPCILPDGIAPEFVSPDPSGMARMAIFEDGTAEFTIVLQGLAPDLVLTAWTSYFFPGGPVPDPIFEPLGEGLPAIAGVSAPLAPTYAAFTEGLGPEPNQFELSSDRTTARLRVSLDFNPLLPFEGPLRNDLVITNQVDAPAGSGAEQPLCCPNGVPEPMVQSVGSSLLRSFDLSTGFQNLDGNGRPVLIRSPLPVAFIAIVAHVDKTTHGINPGVPILPIPGLSVTTGDHFLVGIFDLRAFHFSPSANAPELDADTNGGYTLQGIYPNPFNPSTSFQLSVEEDQAVRIEIYDVLGRRVSTLFDGNMEANQAQLFNFNASNLSSGRYLLQISGQTFSASRNLTFLK